MANAAHDQNGIPTILGTLQSDGQTPIKIKVNPTFGGIKISDGTSGTASTRTTAPHDSNGVHTWMGVSSVDGKTLVVIATDSSGNLLTQST